MSYQASAADECDTPPTPPPSPISQHISWHAASYLVIGLVALLLRVGDLGTFVTIDEAKFWIPRSEQFLHALQTLDFSEVPIVGHPGVTTMWLGGAGIKLRTFLFENGILRYETYETLLLLHRLPTVFVHIGGIMLGYWFLRRLFPALIAALAAWLWATDPFIIAFSRVLHVDMLAGTFATLSVLSAALFWFGPRPPLPLPQRPPLRWLFFSAVMAGLAVLSKLPGMAVIPLVGILAIAAVWRRPEQHPVIEDIDCVVRVVEPADQRQRRGGWRRHYQRHGRQQAAYLALWSAIFLTTFVLCWPTAWVDIGRVVEAVRFGVQSEGGEPHMWGNFFLGRMVDVPGPTFYPVALILRTTPWSLFGLVLLPIGLWRLSPTFRPLPKPTRHTILLLIGFVLLFIVGMSLFPKKHYRYLVPAFPSVDILAAAGLIWGVERLQQMTRIRHWDGKRQRHLTELIGGAIAVIAFVNAVWYHPYSIAAANQLFGGAQTGANTFLAGWGEGFDQVAEWLNVQPDSEHVTTITHWSSVLNPLLAGDGYAEADDRGRLPDGAGYVVVYRSQAQRALEPPYREMHDHAPPLHTVSIHGVEYAWIYDVPQPMEHMEHDATVRFGERLELHSYGVDTSAIRGSGMITITAQWLPHAPLPTDYHLFVHILSDGGERVGQLDVPLRGAANQPTSAWEVGRYQPWTHPLPLPNDLPSGGYWAMMGVYDPQDFSRLPIEAPTNTSAQPETASQPPDDGAHVLVLERLTVGNTAQQEQLPVIMRLRGWFDL
jgi:4-amino-4-deoxy-L-arabinose transferase-like glycosyltransferase